MSITARKPWTAEELNRLPDGWRYEIDEGELVIMVPAGWRHAQVVMRVGKLLSDFVHTHQLGEVGAGEVGIRLQKAPEILRGTDVAFYSNEKLARLANRRSFPDLPPFLQT